MRYQPWSGPKFGSQPPARGHLATYCLTGAINKAPRQLELNRQVSTELRSGVELSRRGANFALELKKGLV